MRSPTSLLAALLALALLPARPLAPQAASESQDYEQRLARIRVEIDSLRGKLAEEEKKEKTMLSALDRIGFTKSLLRNELALLSLQLGKNRVDLAAIKKSIPGIQSNLDRERDALARILVTLYKYGRFDILRAILESSGLAALLGETKHLGLLAAAQERMIADYSKNLTALGKAAEALKAKEAETQDLIRKATAKKAEIDAQEGRNRALVDEITSNKKTYEQTINELNVRAQELQKILQKLETQPPGLMFPLVPFIDRKGKLPWPAAGAVVQKFGIQRHPQYNTVIMNNGLEIAPPKDDLQVRAVQGGKVVFADYIQGYGNSIIINHGGSYHTVYGHCAELLVGLNNFVSDRQVIAVAGDTGSLVGVSVYFQISYQAKPLDPLQWLSRR
jgi:septal ring factor EnvC (AmiA/AmiB activator)